MFALSRIMYTVRRVGYYRPTAWMQKVRLSVKCEVRHSPIAVRCSSQAYIGTLHDQQLTAASQSQSWTSSALLASESPLAMRNAKVQTNPSRT